MRNNNNNENNENIILSCPCYSDDYLQLWFSNIWVAHKFRSVELKLVPIVYAHHRYRVPALISYSYNMSKKDCCKVHLLYIMYVYMYV